MANNNFGKGVDELVKTVDDEELDADYERSWGPDKDFTYYEEEMDWDEIHDEFNPYKSGYETSKANWEKFLKEYGQFANPQLRKIPKWLDRNREMFGGKW